MDCSRAVGVASAGLPTNQNLREWKGQIESGMGTFMMDDAQETQGVTTVRPLLPAPVGTEWKVWGQASDPAKIADVPTTKEGAEMPGRFVVSRAAIWRAEKEDASTPYVNPHVAEAKWLGIKYNPPVADAPAVTTVSAASSKPKLTRVQSEAEFQQQVTTIRFKPPVADAPAVTTVPAGTAPALVSTELKPSALAVNFTPASGYRVVQAKPDSFVYNETLNIDGPGRFSKLNAKEGEGLQPIDLLPKTEPLIVDTSDADLLAMLASCPTGLGAVSLPTTVNAVAPEPVVAPEPASKVATRVILGTQASAGTLDDIPYYGGIRSKFNSAADSFPAAWGMCSDCALWGSISKRCIACNAKPAVLDAAPAAPAAPVPTPMPTPPTPHPSPVPSPTPLPTSPRPIPIDLPAVRIIAGCSLKTATETPAKVRVITGYTMADAVKGGAGTAIVATVPVADTPAVPAATAAVVTTVVATTKEPAPNNVPDARLMAVWTRDEVYEWVKTALGACEEDACLLWAHRFKGSTLCAATENQLRATGISQGALLDILAAVHHPAV